MRQSIVPLSFPKIGIRERIAVDAVLRSGKLAQGKKVEEFEAKFSEVVDGRGCVAVNSGTSALHLSLLAAGLGPGDEVIVPSFTFAATANAVALTGAKPIFADIDSRTFCLDPDAAASMLSSRTKAIMPVHLYGQPADMTRIVDLANKNSLMVFEDAAQAHLARWNDKPVGTFGEAGSFSFYPTKNMTSGEGGIVAAESIQLERTIRLLRNQGMQIRYQNELVGFNNRMTEIHAAIGLIQLHRLENWTNKRIENARYLTENLKNVIVPYIDDQAKHVFHQYTLTIDPLERDGFMKELKNLGVGCDVYYPTPVSDLRPFNNQAGLPNTLKASMSCLSIPVHPHLKKWQLEKVVESVNKVAKAGA